MVSEHVGLVKITVLELDYQNVNTYILNFGSGLSIENVGCIIDSTKVAIYYYISNSK